jgi:hypothetical protein
VVVVVSEENPYVAGPGPGYDPPPVDELVDPGVKQEARLRGSALCRRVLEDLGIRKVDGRWVRDEA